MSPLTLLILAALLWTLACVAGGVLIGVHVARRPVARPQAITPAPVPAPRKGVPRPPEPATRVLYSVGRIEVSPEVSRRLRAVEGGRRG